MQDYHLADLNFAYCIHVFLRFRTHRSRPCQPLTQLDSTALNDLAAPFGIRILECNAGPTDLGLLVSLKPEEAVATAVSKLKGRISRRLREALRLDRPTELLARGYFACTAGKSTRAQVEQYLENQDRHHGYASRAVPPTFVAEYAPTAALDASLRAHHCFTILRFHAVFATGHRHGVFAAPEAETVAARWLELQPRERFALLKVSFLPDHVHLALRTHPGVAPGPLAVALMNAAQAALLARHPDALVTASLARLWQPSAYIGSYGDLASPQIQSYLRHWTQADPS